MENPLPAKSRCPLHSRFKRSKNKTVMRNVLSLVGFILLAATVLAQPPSPSLVLPDSISQVDPEWIDLDNDGLLDVFMLMKTKSNKSYIGIIKGDILNPLSRIDKAFSVIAHHAY